MPLWFQLNCLTLKHSKFKDCGELKRKMRQHLYELNCYLVSGGRLWWWCWRPLMGSPKKILNFLNSSVCLFTLEPGQNSEAHNELPYCACCRCSQFFFYVLCFVNFTFLLLNIVTFTYHIFYIVLILQIVKWCNLLWKIYQNDFLCHVNF